MFALFYNLYFAMFRGTWTPLNINEIANCLKTPFNAIGQLITSIFNNVDTPMSNFGDVMFAAESTFTGAPNYLHLTAFILALITSIGIVVLAVKGIKKAFGIFFMGIR